MATPTPQIPLATASDYAYSAYAAASDAAPLHGDCRSPVDRELRGVGSIITSRLRQWAANDDLDYADGYGHLGDFKSPQARTVVIRVRCRKCPECLEHKRRLWTARAIQEVRQARRTWFGTLTVGPDNRFRAKAKAEALCEQRRAERFSMLTPPERTKAIAGQLHPEVTKWLKRVRKVSKARLRYLLVVEPHKDGFPHFHLLLHELDQPVTKATLESQWTIGFSQWRLVPAMELRPTYYVCKYLTKSSQTRVRASRHYGQPDGGLISERVRELIEPLTHFRATPENGEPSV